MNENALIYVGILLATIWGLADRPQAGDSASSSIGRLAMSETSWRAEDEFEDRGDISEGSESTLLVSDERANGGSGAPAARDTAETSKMTGHQGFEPFAGTFKSEMKLWMLLRADAPRYRLCG